MKKTLTALVAVAALSAFAGQAMACGYHDKTAMTKKPTVTAQAEQPLLPQTPKTTTTETN